jgi:hypothetical protein
MQWYSFACLNAKADTRVSWSERCAKGSQVEEIEMARDYHAYRSYGEDLDRKRVRRGALAGLITGVRRLLKAVLKFGAPRTPPGIVLRDGRRNGFSTLGTGSGLRRPADCPFPAAAANDVKSHGSHR